MTTKNTRVSTNEINVALGTKSLHENYSVACV